ncbi:MAG: glycosyltransferase, partial [Chryseobacterium gambrini]|nr:glycosyltransferase [Chryseobacterium gambrini]
GGITEIIQDDTNGEIANIENYEEFSQKIMKILHENHENEAIKNSIKSRFSKNIILNQYEKVLLDLMK